MLQCGLFRSNLALPILDLHRPLSPAGIPDRLC
jgi:hypothetical protein